MKFLNYLYQAAWRRREGLKALLGLFLAFLLFLILGFVDQYEDYRKCGSWEYTCEYIDKYGPPE